jgi:hypothetical protein
MSLALRRARDRQHNRHKEEKEFEVVRHNARTYRRSVSFTIGRRLHRAQIDPQVRRLIIFDQCRASLFGNNDFKLIDYAPCFVFSFAGSTKTVR